MTAKTHNKKKNEFSSFTNAKFSGGMFLPTWTMVDKPSDAVMAEELPDSYWQHSHMAHPSIAKS